MKNLSIPSLLHKREELQLTGPPAGFSVACEKSYSSHWNQLGGNRNMLHLKATFKLEVSWQQRQITRLKTRPAEVHTQFILNQMLDQKNQKEEGRGLPTKAANAETVY